MGKDNEVNDVCYNANCTYVNTNHNNEKFDGEFTSIHNFGKLKELVQDIFGKYTAQL